MAGGVIMLSHDIERYLSLLIAETLTFKRPLPSNGHRLRHHLMRGISVCGTSSS